MVPVPAAEPLPVDDAVGAAEPSGAELCDPAADEDSAGPEGSAVDPPDVPSDVLAAEVVSAGGGLEVAGADVSGAPPPPLVGPAAVEDGGASPAEGDGTASRPQPLAAPVTPLP